MAKKKTKADTPRPTRLKDYRAPAYLISHVDLDVSLDPSRTRIHAHLSVRPNPAAGQTAGPLALDGAGLELAGLSLDGKPLDPKDYKLTDTSLVIPKPPSKPFTLDITTFVDPSANKSLQGLYRSRGVYCTQCEAEGFR